MSRYRNPKIQLVVLMDISKTFGELRSLLQHAPNLRAWYCVCALMEQWPPDAFEQEVLPYIQTYIARPPWSKQSRLAPTRWVLDVIDGHPMPYLLMASDIMIRRHEITSSHLETLRRCEYLGCIEQLRFEHVTINPTDLKATLSTLGVMDNLPMLFGLHFKDLALTPSTLNGLLQGSLVDQVQLLSLRATSFDRQTLDVLIQTRTLDALRELDIRDHNLGDTQTQYLIKHIAATCPRLLRLGIACSSNASSPQTHQHQLQPPFRLF